jgi:hypothetical protein
MSKQTYDEFVNGKSFGTDEQPTYDDVARTYGTQQQYRFADPVVTVTNKYQRYEAMENSDMNFSVNKIVAEQERYNAMWRTDRPAEPDNNINDDGLLASDIIENVIDESETNKISASDVVEPFENINTEKPLSEEESFINDSKDEPADFIDQEQLLIDEEGANSEENFQADSEIIEEKNQDEIIDSITEPNNMNVLQEENQEDNTIEFFSDLEANENQQEYANIPVDNDLCSVNIEIDDKSEQTEEDGHVSESIVEEVAPHKEEKKEIKKPAVKKSPAKKQESKKSKAPAKKSPAKKSK